MLKMHFNFLSRLAARNGHSRNPASFFSQNVCDRLHAHDCECVSVYCMWFCACWYRSLSSPCFFLTFVDCEAPFVYSACGAPCEKQCALQGREDLCLGVRECTPGCYCPQVMISFTLVYFIVYTGYIWFKSTFTPSLTLFLTLKQRELDHSYNVKTWKFAFSVHNCGFWSLTWQVRLNLIL